MDKEECLALIEELNGYCNCKDLIDLYKIKRKASPLGKKCNNLENKIDFKTPAEKDRVPLEILKENRIDLDNFVNAYYQELNALIKKGRLELYYHNENNNYFKEKVKSNSALELLKQNKIVTIHCANCDQQIDLANQ